MDIAYLLFLQDFRQSIHDIGTPFLQGVSLFSISCLFLIPIFIYWCISKRSGLYIWASFCVAYALNAVLKLTVCAYRPWIRDPRIIPAGNAIATAGGYSFPSGHTICASTLYGGTAVTLWRYKTTKWLSYLCIFFILLTGFSRNYLGVHTPQDVLVGLILGGLTLWGMNRLFIYLVSHPEQENKWLLGGFLLAIAMLLFITLKPYPHDYVDGKLLVDPQKMLNDAYHAIGFLLAFCPARYIEKRWVKFTETGFSFKGILVGLLGLLPVGWMFKHLTAPCVAFYGPHWGRLVCAVCIIFYVILFFPIVLKFLCHSTKHN